METSTVRRRGPPGARSAAALEKVPISHRRGSFLIGFFFFFLNPASHLDLKPEASS